MDKTEQKAGAMIASPSHRAAQFVVTGQEGALTSHPGSASHVTARFDQLPSMVSASSRRSFGEHRSVSLNNGQDSRRHTSVPPKGWCLRCWREPFQLLPLQSNSAHLGDRRKTVDVVALCGHTFGEVSGVPCCSRPRLMTTPVAACPTAG